jgi:hypothetical protein
MNTLERPSWLMAYRNPGKFEAPRGRDSPSATRSGGRKTEPGSCAALFTRRDGRPPCCGSQGLEDDGESVSKSSGSSFANHFRVRAAVRLLAWANILTSRPTRIPGSPVQPAPTHVLDSESKSSSSSTQKVVVSYRKKTRPRIASCRQSIGYCRRRRSVTGLSTHRVCSAGNSLMRLRARGFRS